MKRTGIAFALLIVSAVGAKAQGTQVSTVAASAAPVIAVNSTQAIVSPYYLREAALASARPAAPRTGIDPGPKGIHGAFRQINTQLFVGYTYIRFYEVPLTVLNTNGVVGSVTYFANDWLGFEGEADGGVGSPAATGRSSLTFVGGGIHVREASPFHRAQMWAHAIAGGAHQGPKTTFGSQGAFAFEGGGGLDFNTRSEHLGYRLEVDAIGTMFFNTYQINPKVAFGILYRF